MAYFQALEEIRQHGAKEVPSHLKDTHRDAAALGHGEGYLYPHDFPSHWVEQQYLPEGVEGGWYHPSEEGYERYIKERLERWRRRGEKENP
jgi:putative ATPase